MIKMPCPICGHSNTHVRETRPNREGVRRRRQCAGCRHRFTTQEVIVERGKPVVVLKENVGGTRNYMRRLKDATASTRKAVDNLNSLLRQAEEV